MCLFVPNWQYSWVCLYATDSELSPVAHCEDLVRRYSNKPNSTSLSKLHLATTQLHSLFKICFIYFFCYILSSAGINLSKNKFLIVYILCNNFCEGKNNFYNFVLCINESLIRLSCFFSSCILLLIVIVSDGIINHKDVMQLQSYY